MIGRHLPAHPSTRQGQVTLALPAGPVEDGGKKMINARWNGGDMHCMSVRKIPIVGMSQGQAKSISPTGL